MRKKTKEEAEEAQEKDTTRQEQSRRRPQQKSRIHRGMTSNETEIADDHVGKLLYALHVFSKHVFFCPQD